MLLRFVIDRVSPDSGRRLGIFHAAYAMRRGVEMPACERERLERLVGWLGRNTVRPPRFALSRRPHAKEQAISWFRHTSLRHLAHARELANVLAANGVMVHEIRTRRPGYVVYEDDIQVVAYPFADTPT